MKAEQSSVEEPDLAAWPSAAISAWISLKFGLNRGWLVETLRMRLSMFDDKSVDPLSCASDAFRTKIQAIEPATTSTLAQELKA